MTTQAKEYHRRMYYPAPAREWYHTGKGWATRAWDVRAILEQLAIGGHFSGNHDFASEEATRIAHMTYQQITEALAN